MHLYIFVTPQLNYSELIMLKVSDMQQVPTLKSNLRIVGF